jgi:hypothetical protein
VQIVPDENLDHSTIFRIQTLAFMILWQAIADGMYPICSQKSMPSWSDCVKECGTGATQRVEETNGASHCALKLPDLLPQLCCSGAVPRGDPPARAQGYQTIKKI